MAEHTKISWADHTMNPWWGCTKVSPGCTNCYADTYAQRRGKQLWGNNPRMRTKGPWTDVLKWNRDAKNEGQRRRVFCASMADVFEDHPMLPPWRAELWQVIEECSSLDWLMLTKRPQHIRQMAPSEWMASPRPHVWWGTSTENQRYLAERVHHLLGVPGPVHFLSAEPLLSALDLEHVDTGRICEQCDAQIYRDVRDAGDNLRCECEWLGTHEDGRRISWVICGGESGSGRREMDLRWARCLRSQCQGSRVAFWFKQVSAFAPGKGEDALGAIIQELPQVNA